VPTSIIVLSGGRN